uniref:Uncharacterized protein n=1 Tax=Oryza brachyantha TaxID=4533 RepID=J3M4T4_ORYBR
MDDDNEPSPWGCCKFWTPLSVTFLILWLFYRPDRFHPSVDSGVLAALHLADDNATDHQKVIAKLGAVSRWHVYPSF